MTPGSSPCRVFRTRHGEAAMPDEHGRFLNYSDAGRASAPATGVERV
jgi:hypothetical protein